MCQHKLSCSIVLVLFISLGFLSIMSQALQYDLRFQYQEQAVGFIVYHISVSSVNRALYCMVRLYEFPTSFQHCPDGQLYFLIFIFLILFELCYMYWIRYCFIHYRIICVTDGQSFATRRASTAYHVVTHKLFPAVQLDLCF